MNKKLVVPLLSAAVILPYNPIDPASSAGTARDPGVRAGADAGNPLPGLSRSERAFFDAGKDDFNETEAASDGLGPTMNLDSCGGCHSQPAAGGTSPTVNPQVAFANALGARNRIPSFIRRDGPVREARFVKNADGSPDGGVHALFTISGRSDAPGCALSQPDFETQLARGNVIFRIPTPVFGAGLIEQIPDSTIAANQAADATLKRSLGILGRANIILPFHAISGQYNRNGNDGTIARFGWKAQNKSLLLFSGEAYNVEMGISNELFQTEREENAGCQFAGTPNNVADVNARGGTATISGIERFSFFMRFLDAPKPSSDSPGGSTSIARGKLAFAAIACALCHTPSMPTANSSVTALKSQPVHLFSDLLVHDMGTGLADGVSQGQAGPREFRTAPLWGLGQRVFFLHDGRTSDLIAAIRAHQSLGSEANGVVNRFSNLTETQKQSLLNFLRSL